MHSAKRRQRIGAASVAAAALLAAAPVASSSPFSRAVNEQVRAARRIAPALGVHVVRVSDGVTVYGYRADTPRIIASNAKLLTTAAALDRLGPGFFVETPVLIRGTVAGGVLDGDLAVVGGGDPHLSGRAYFGDSFGPFREWAAALTAEGVTRIAGDLVLDHGLFEDGLVHPDWPRDQLTRWYEAPVSALSFSDNCILVTVEPGAAAGRPAVVETTPPLGVFGIESTAVTTAQRNAHRVHIDRRPAGNVLTVAGRVYQHAKPVEKWVTVEDPVVYFGQALRTALAEEGIAVDGRVRALSALPGVGWRRLTVHRTDLLTLLEVINKRSQNFYAESLLKVLGARRCGSGSWRAGLEAVRELLDELGIVDGYRLADGSGMSRNNRFTPAGLTRLLRAMAVHRWSQPFMQSLPYSGERGLRWAKRLAEPPYRGNVLAKTGTLNGVSTLSGYLKARSGTLYAFSILLNDTRSDWRAKKAQDAIVRAVIDHG